MHPTKFRLCDHQLGDWPDCWIEARCVACSETWLGAVKMLRRDFGDRMTFAGLVNRMRCSKCRRPFQPIYLCESPRRSLQEGVLKDGVAPGWSIEMVPHPVWRASRGSRA